MQDDIGMGTPQQPKQHSSVKFSSRARARNAPCEFSLSLLFLHCIPDGVLGAACSALHLPCRFFRGPFGLRLGVAGHFADSSFTAPFT
jgi:hypothetical protein